MADAKRANGTIAADTQAVTISPNGRGCVAIELTGTWSINLDIKSLVDGTEENAKVYNAAGSAVSLPLTTNQIVYAYAAGREQIIVRANGYTSGSVAVVMNATDGLPFVASAGGGGGGGGAVTAANPGDFVDGWDTTFGAKADASAAADNTTTTYMSLFKRLLARITSLITALGSPFQAGGSIANTTFASTQSGTWTVQPGNTANTTAWKTDGSAVTQPTAGSVAHGTANSGNPITEGRVAIAHGTNPTAVAAAARTDMYANRAGVPFVIGGHPNVQTFAQNFTAAQTDTAIVTVAAGLKIVVTGFMITCSNANSVNVSARLGFGTVNTPAYGAAGLIGTHPNIAPGSGFGRGGGSGIVGVGADDADLRLTCSVPTSGSVDCMVSYYTCES